MPRLTITENHHRRRENNPAFKGGNYNSNHLEAIRLFKLDNCEICGVHKDDTKGKFELDLHCKDHGDHTLMKRSNWLTCCRSCHMMINLEIKKYGRI